ncbi:unnamed protein product, partial [Rhizoctonia solani]
MQSLTYLAQQMTHPANQPVVGLVNQVLMNVEALGGRLNEMDGAFAEMQARLSDRLHVMDRVSVASSLNASALDDAAELFALPLPNGDMPGDVFPPTLGALRALTGNELNNLINMYGMVENNNIPHLVADCRKLVGHYFG